MKTLSQMDRGTLRAAMPRGVRAAVLAGAGLLLVGALYLISVRGEALLLDLSALGARFFCL